MGHCSFNHAVRAWRRATIGHSPGESPFSERGGARRRIWGLKPGSARSSVIALALICALEFVRGQGVIVPLNTGGGQPLVTEMSTVTVGADLLQPRLEFNFGFATDESVAPETFLDSFTLTIQDANRVFTAVLLTADASGTELAPTTPGTVAIDPATISTAAIAYPNLQPVLANQQAFQASVAIPTQFFGGEVDVFFDLFDNLDARASQGWFSDLRVTAVPEPQACTLLLLAGSLCWRLKQTRTKT